MEGLAILKRHIKEKKPAPLYLFHGEERYLLDFYLKQLQDLLVPAGTEAFNLSLLEGKQFTTERFVEAMDAAPFMADRRMVLVREVDIYKADGTMKDLLLTYLSRGWEGCVLVIVYGAIPYKPDARTKLYKAVAALGVVAEFKEQSTTDLVPWVIRRFKALKKTIDTQNAKYLLFLCGSLMTVLVQEIEKIAAYCTVDTITQRHIDAVGTPTMEAVVFDMTDAISAKEYGKALTILRKLLDLREEPIMLLGALGKQVRGLYLARLAYENGQGRQVVMQGMGYRSSYPADKLMQACRRIQLPWCRQAVLRCARADSDLKWGRDKAAVMEQLLLELASC